jgi:hypothetical protein
MMKRVQADDVLTVIDPNVGRGIGLDSIPVQFLATVGVAYRMVRHPYHGGTRCNE